MQDASGIKTRELTPDEKAVVSHAVGLSVSNPNSAQFKWPQIADTEDGAINYCGMVKANSPYGPYSGWQAYIVEGTISGGKLKSAVVGLIAGGKDVEIVIYPDAGHGFHADYRPSYNAADAADGWQRLLAWFHGHGV